MYAEDVYKTQTPLPRKFNIIWKCTEHPLCQPTEASNYPREECWKQLELLTFFLVSSMHDRLLSSVWLKFINSPPQILMDRLQPPALFCLSFLSFCCLLSQATTTGEEIHRDHILLFKWATYFQCFFGFSNWHTDSPHIENSSAWLISGLPIWAAFPKVKLVWRAGRANSDLPQGRGGVEEAQGSPPTLTFCQSSPVPPGRCEVHLS